MSDIALTSIEKRVLQFVLTTELPSRLKLASSMSVSPQTLTRAVKTLIERGILSETAQRSGARGQPVRILSYRSGSLSVIGLVLTEHRVAVLIEDLGGTMIHAAERAGDFGLPELALTTAENLLGEALSKLPAGSVPVGLGVAAQGFFTDRGKRIVARGAPAAWAQTDLHARLSKAVDLPVSIQNDARAIAAGSIRQNMHKRYSHYFCVYLGSGIGGGAVVNGAIFDGSRGNAGEIGGLVADDASRPTLANFLSAAGIGAVREWRGFERLDPARRTFLLEWCASAAGVLSQLAQAILALLDIDAILIHSNIPREVVETIRTHLVVRPIGADLLNDPALLQLLHLPEILIVEESSLDRGACAVAVDTYLSMSPSYSRRPV